MRTVALRFAENFAPDAGTIAAHEDVIARLGYVWYGKMGSAVSQRVASDLMANEEPRILLIHSGGTRRFWAYIDAVQRETPDLDGIPAYYRDKAGDFGYWFRARRFEAAPKDVMAQCTVPSSGNKLSIASRRSMSPYFIIDAPDDWREKRKGDSLAQELNNENDAIEGVDDNDDGTLNGNHDERSADITPPITIHGITKAQITALGTQKALFERITRGLDIKAYEKAFKPAYAAAEAVKAYYGKAFGDDLRTRYIAALPKIPMHDFSDIVARIPVDEIAGLSLSSSDLALADLKTKVPPDYLSGAFVSLPSPDLSIVLPQGLTADIAALGSKLSDYVLKSAGLATAQQSMMSTALEALKPQLNAIGHVLNSVDVDAYWADFRSGVQRWGEHGWVVIMSMPVWQIKEGPSSLKEADSIGRHYAKLEMDRLRKDIVGSVRKPKDAAEMFALFDEGHLKPCAMLACSLIDGEFMYWAIAQTKDRKTRRKPKNMLPIDEVGPAQTTYARLIGIASAYDHFFKYADGFDRSIEGELNRNFLMHGMMYKSVSKTTCIKLFLLLDEVVKLIPLSKIGEGSLLAAAHS